MYFEKSTPIVSTVEQLLKLDWQFPGTEYRGWVCPGTEQEYVLDRFQRHNDVLLEGAALEYFEDEAEYVWLENEVPPTVISDYTALKALDWNIPGWDHINPKYPPFERYILAPWVVLDVMEAFNHYHGTVLEGVAKETFMEDAASYYYDNR